MPSFSYKTFMALAASMLYRLASADVESITGYPSDDCSESGFYNTFSTQADSNSCSAISYGASEFELVNDNYQIYWKLQEGLNKGCEIALLGEPTDSERDCGECLGRVSSVGGCTLIPVPKQFYVTWCCGDECRDYCGAPGKRSLDSNWTEPVKVERATLPKANPAKMKSQPLIKERSACTFKGNGGTYNKAGAPVQVTKTINTCPSENGCAVDYSGTVEQSFSQSFGVSETTEAGLFDIISESITFSYTATWEKSKSVTESGSFTVPKGEGGYVTFSPLSQCIDGSFSGDDCEGMVDVDKDGTACIPEVLEGGKLNGDLNLVIAG